MGHITVRISGDRGPRGLPGNGFTFLKERLSDPPANPTAGDRFLVSSGATGAWDGLDGLIAEWSGSAWIMSGAAGLYLIDETPPAVIAIMPSGTIINILTE